MFFKNSQTYYVLVYQCILVTPSRRLHSSSLINITSDTTSTFLINNLRPQNRRQTGLRFLQNCCDSFRILNCFHIRKAEQFLQGRLFCADGPAYVIRSKGGVLGTQRKHLQKEVKGSNMNNRSSGEEADLSLKNDPASSTLLLFHILSCFILLNGK